MKSLADAFIKENRNRYGLTGTNIAHNPYKGYPGYQYQGQLFSRDNHFLYGYNGMPLNWRRSSSCMYYTTYGPMPRKAIYPGDAIGDALKEVYETFGSFLLVNDGSTEAHAIAEAAIKTGTPIEQLVISMGEHGVVYPYDGRITTHVYTLHNDMFRNYMEEFCAELRVKSSKVILDMMIAVCCPKVPLLVFPGQVKTIDHNATGLAQPCGPQYAAIEDYEEDTALHRFAIKRERRNILPDFCRWSPELIRSLATQGTGVSVIRSFDRATDVVDEAFPSIQEGVQSWHDKAKHNEVWHTPIYGESTAYGVVFEDD